MNTEQRHAIEANVITVLRTIFDPEIPVDIYELGLIYEIAISDDADVKIVMTLTSPNCPVAESLPAEVKEKVGLVKNIRSADVELTFEPPWDQSMLSEEAKLELGFL
ncbi:MAG: FeS assembly SUF system protein [Bacteroidetes bacterium HGW-Bacteroidetes-1]|jgi:FeS assembly SUF system protein|nr:MAG: FeS assembly SUF system protein [Bacteroidetes bacterium HGW-Bacteroidetes-1]